MSFDPRHDVHDFAAAVNNEALAVGGDQVWIAFVFDGFQHSDFRMSRAAFNAMLIEAHRRGLVRLSRADLFDDDEVQALRMSHVRHLNADFHLVDVDWLINPQFRTFTRKSKRRS